MSVAVAARGEGGDTDDGFAGDPQGKHDHAAAFAAYGFGFVLFCVAFAAPG